MINAPEQYLSHESYRWVADTREQDLYPDNLSKSNMIENFFPQSVDQLTKDLSTVTSLFYAIMLETCITLLPANEVDKISTDFFYRLGRRKTQSIVPILQMNNEFHRDTRALIMILITAIYNASPEYIFKVIKYSEKHSIIKLTGVDRYFRAAHSLNIAHLLTWPTLLPFFHGINDELGLQCEISSVVNQLNPDGSCDIDFNIVSV